MAVRIKNVEYGSKAHAAGIRSGEYLFRINGNEITDVLDYRYFSADRALVLALGGPGGIQREVLIKNSDYAPLGLEFETYLMDEKRSCRNNCIFCFIDQLPKGMRESLYFKDDDMRLSLLTGNYITLTNLSEADMGKIKKFRISPLNISVHSTDPEIRRKMMRNKNAGSCYEIMKDLADCGITMNCQIVVCPGINDGENLRKTLSDLILMYPHVNSVSVVPVGLTAHRSGLYPLQAVDKISALNIIKIVENSGNMALKSCGSRVVYAADELYLKAGLPIPPYEYYEDFAQLENGVGMVLLFENEFLEAVSLLESGIPAPPPFSVATGVAAAPFISGLVERLKQKCPGLSCAVYPVKNRVFGEMIDVSGLVTGSDLISGLKGKKIGERLLIPSNMLMQNGRVFLDDLTLEDVERELDIRLVPVKNNGGALVKALLKTGGAY